MRASAVPKHVIDKRSIKQKEALMRTSTRRTLRRIWTKWFDVDRWYFDFDVNTLAANVVLLLVKTVGNMGASGSAYPPLWQQGVIVFAGDDADAIFKALLEANIWCRWCRSRRKERSQSTLLNWSSQKQSVLCVNQVSRRIQVTELEMIPQSSWVVRWRFGNIWKTLQRSWRRRGRTKICKRSGFILM